MNTLISIPYELFLMMIHFLDVSSILSLSHTSKNLLAHVLSDSAIRKISMIDVYDDAVANKHVQLFKWYVSDKHVLEDYHADKCRCKCRCRKCIFMDHGYGFCIKAAKSDNIEILKYMLDDVLPPCEDSLLILQAAGKGGSLEIVKWIYSKYTFSVDTNKALLYNLCINAAGGGHLELLKFLYDNKCPWDEYICAEAAYNGHLDVLKFLHEHSCPWDTPACAYAAFGNHFEILKYLHENGCPWNTSACTHASGGVGQKGNLDMIKYLHENGCPWDSNTYVHAIKSKRLDIVEYLFENNCPIDKSACLCAAFNNNLEILIYLLKNGFPWDEWACSRAFTNGHTKIVEMFHQNGCQCEKNQCSIGVL